MSAPTEPSPPADGASDAPVLIRHSWSHSSRFVPRAFVRPLRRFLHLEAAGGIAMLIAAVAALVWANSPWQGSYTELWETTFAIELGHLAHVDLSLRDWINDAAMAVFFFVVGMEIKRELVAGELRDPRAAALPAIAALGGMITPALIYLVFNAGGAGARGWGIPMATDIAFAAGVVALLGNRVPTGAKLFLLTLAIVDDLGAIVVIAIFYSSGLAFGWLALAIGTLGVTYAFRRSDVRSLLPYLVLGVTCWYALHESGVHATLAGVAFGFLTPVWSFYDPSRFPAHARTLVDAVDRDVTVGGLDHGDLERTNDRLRELTRLATESASPLDRLEHRLAPWVSFLVVPVFALANAGVHLTGETLSGALGDRIVLGVAAGLLVGKTVGVFSFTWIACRIGIGKLPAGTNLRHLLGLSVCAGIGFTVAIFVAGLAFTDPASTEAAKVGILGASLVAGLVGAGILRSTKPSSPLDGPVEPVAVASAPDGGQVTTVTGPG